MTLPASGYEARTAVESVNASVSFRKFVHNIFGYHPSGWIE